MKKKIGVIGLVSAGTVLFAGLLQAAAPSKQVAEGKALYAEACALCHGADGKRGEGFQTPIWGEGSFIATKFGNAQGLIDYMQLMPFNDPALLTDEQKISVVAYILSNHGAMAASESLDPAKAPSIPIK